MTKCLNLNILLVFCVLFAGFGLFSCTNDRVDAPDVSAINIDLNIIRSEQAIASLDTNQTLQSLNNLLKKDSSFYSNYFGNALRVPLDRLDDEKKTKFIKGFIRDDRIQRINQEVDSVFGDFSDMKASFESSFRYLKYYFPEKEIPDIYTFISEYSVQRFIFQENDTLDGLAIGLDMFLGENYPYAKYVNNHPSFSNYLTRRFNKEHMVKKVFEVMVEDWLNGQMGPRMLDKMIYNGKKLYILQQLLPYTDEHIIMEYTEDQLEWCQDNESEMWAFFFDEDLFYSTDINKISKLVNPSPNSSGMPPEAPGRTANYMGFQIVKAFMKRNPEISLQELIAFDESQKILEKSRYKPKRK